jgi:hypothetical protein
MVRNRYSRGQDLKSDARLGESDGRRGAACSSTGEPGEEAASVGRPVGTIVVMVRG